jgi:hypothetical protein
MGLGLLLSGLSGAGKGAAEVGEQAQKVSDEQALMAARAKLEEEKQLRIEEARSQRERQAGIKQGKDISAGVNDIQNQRDAEAINAANGSSMSAADAQVLRDNPAARKAYGLLDSNRKSDMQDRASAAEKLGYLDAAKEARGQVQDEITNKRAEDLDKNTNRRLDQQDTRQASMDKYNMNRESRLDRIAEAQLSFNKARAGKEDARSEQMAVREQRQATQYALKSAQDDIKTLEKEAADPMATPEQAANAKNQIGRLRSEAGRYRAALAAGGMEGSEAAPKAFDPADFPVGGKATPKASAPAAPSATSSDERRAKTVDGRTLKSKEQLAEEDAQRESFRKVSGGGNANRENALKQRTEEASRDFDAKLAMVKRGASKAEIGGALDWFESHDEQLSNAQRKQLREARKSAGY